jgi:polyisoprenyl-phosphate glycosyltransferase
LDPQAPACQPLQVDIVIPVYNEEEAVAIFHEQLRQALDVLPHHFTVIYINDGSRDQTAAVLKSIADQDERVLIVELSRNFGQQAALTAGLDLAKGDWVITMDGDGQHPPSLIAEMLQLAQSGYDVVSTQRIEAEPGRGFKSWTSTLFYRVINRIGDTQILPGSADFRLLSRQAVQAVRGMREYHRLIRGMVAWAGYRSVILPYQQPARLQGTSKYSLRRLLHLAFNAIFSFSLVPLYIGITVGLIFLLLALLEMIYVLSFWVTGNQSGLAPGWSSLMFVLLVVGGSLMIAIGFIGVYVGYIFQEVKRRPIYLIRSEPPGTEAAGPYPGAEPGNDETAHA